MRRVLNWSIYVVVAVALCVTIVRLRLDNGPRYGGRSLSGWLSVLNGANFQRAAEARSAIREMGTNALPCALRWIQEKRAEPFWSDPEEEPLSRGDMAPGIFRVLGAAAKPAIPDLAKIAFTNSLASDRAVNSLAAIGPDALPSLLGIATNSIATAECRRRAMLELEKFKTNLDVVLPALVHNLQETNLETALVAFDAVIRLDSKSRMLLPVLANELENPELAMRLRAIQALANYRSDAREMIPALARRLEDSEPRVRRFATNALNRIAPDIYTNVWPERVRVSAAPR